MSILQAAYKDSDIDTLRSRIHARFLVHRRANISIYGIWAFENGEFTNKGDGGWINWAFKGSFDRDGSHVKFH